MPGVDNPADRGDAGADLASTLGGLSMGATAGRPSPREPCSSSASGLGDSSGGSSFRQAPPAQERAAAVSAPSADRPGLLTCQALSCLATTGKNGAPLFACAGCGYSAYCCKDHQKSDWPLHKHFCRNAGSEPAPAAATPWQTESLSPFMTSCWVAAVQEQTAIEAAYDGGDTEPALIRARAMLTDVDALFGRGTPATAGALDTLARLLVFSSLYEEALPIATRSLAIAEKRWGEQSVVVLKSLSLLANILVGLNRDDAAAAAATQCLSIAEACLGKNSPFVAMVVYNMATVADRQGRAAEAMALHKRGLAIRTAVKGAADHAGLALDRRKLGVMHLDADDPLSAAPLLRSVLDSEGKTSGRESIEYARCCANLACCFEASGGVLLAEALPLREHAASVMEKTLGECSEEFCLALFNVAAVHGKMGAWQLASRAMQRTVALMAEVFGPTHARTADAQDALRLFRERDRGRHGIPGLG